MAELTPFEIPKFHVLLASGKYVARRTLSGFELRPVDDKGPVYRVQVLDDKPHPRFLASGERRRSR